MTITLTEAPPAAPVARQIGRLQAYRDDGPICTTIGRLTLGRLIPLPGTVVAALTTAALLLVAGAQEHAIPVLYAPLVALLLTGPSATHPHTGRIDWLVPPILRGIEYGYLAVLGFAQGVSAPLIYGLLAVLAYHHYDTVYRTRQHLWPRGWVFRAGLGWEGRMLIAAFAGLFGQLSAAYAVLAAYLGVLFGVESVIAWVRADRGSGVQVNLEEEAEEAS
ncbi:hypothetical protein SAMN04489712_12761 [Thermomonospora echinospora]|uniref:DUF5941 domain-containing protein n=1 Tax=Thermomonospora echinospora TaxID=1992 RepID=A0A1H6E114_9ACTN|nr:DUF5941 domain-containing protein [Thermomonospora echinospora]SEG90864.1 hypothetical protein SAMN04489712_12761 [Thermomonospora echinospora]